MAILTLRASAQRSRYSNNNNNKNNNNGGYSSGQSGQYGDKINPKREGKTYSNI